MEGPADDKPRSRSEHASPGTARLDTARPGEPLASYTLAVVGGPDDGQMLPLEAASPSPLHVGTSAASALVLSDPTVSRRHVSFEVVPEGVRVVDAGSTNGTYLGAIRLGEAVLQGGEVLRVGSTSLRLTRLEGTVDAALPTEASFGRVLGASDEMRKLHPLLARLASTEVPVVIEGETGTGKEVVAEAIHDASRRKHASFVVFDCTTVPPSLMEAALFGHEKGAFTGAVSARPGVFEQANGGTLLLDEIGDLDLALQPKLLRAVQRSEVQRVGGSAWLKVNVRLLAATRRDLEREVQDGRFRDDLFFRLAVARLELPPLRRRRGDVRFLAERFWAEMGGAASGIAPELLARFEAYAWPGNVRELYNTIARHVALGEFAEFKERNAAAAPDVAADPIAEALDEGLSFAEARERVVREFERRFLERALAAHGGNVTRAAHAVGIARRHFHRLIARATSEQEP